MTLLQEKDMIRWNQHKDFPPEVMARHHDFVLYDIYHHIKAFLLYPPNCSCEDACLCHEFRAKIVLTLNLSCYRKQREENETLETLYAKKLLLKIPEERFLAEGYEEGYPVWLIQREYHDRKREQHFKSVEELVWTMLRVAGSYALFFKQQRVSLTEAIERLTGKTPLKAKGRQQDDRCGEKAYATRFNAYKSVSHFIVAFGVMRKESENQESLTLTTPDQIERFLKISHWFRKKLLPLETPNTKEKFLFPEKSLIPLPVWVNSDGLDILIEPFEDIVQEIQAQLDDPANLRVPGESRKKKDMLE